MGLKMTQMWITELLRAPAAGGGAGAGSDAGDDTAPGAGGDDTAPASGGEDTAPAAGGNDTPSGGGEDTPGGIWYDDFEWTDPQLKDYLVKSGYHKETQGAALERALKGEMAATQKLGKGADQLMDRPAADANLAEFFKTNGDAFGVPDKAEGYDLKVPDDLPKEIPIDSAMLENWKAHAHANGLPASVAQAGLDFHVEQQKALMQTMATDAGNAETAMMNDLTKAWGGQVDANIGVAKRTFQAMAAAAEMDPAASRNLAEKLNAEMGDAHFIKFFHKMHDVISEDSLAIPSGAGQPSMQLANAEQRKAQIMEKGTGDMAMAMGDTRKTDALQKELAGLNAIIMQHKG